MELEAKLKQNENRRVCSSEREQQNQLGELKANVEEARHPSGKTLENYIPKKQENQVGQSVIPNWSVIS